MKKALFFAFAVLLGGLVQAMKQEKNIEIKFYKKSTRNERLFGSDPIGYVWYKLNYPDFKENEACLYIMRLEDNYRKKNLMKPLALYAISYIFKTNSNIDTIKFWAVNIENVSTNILNTIYLKTGADFDGRRYFNIQKKQFHSSFFQSILQLPIEKKSQMFKDIYIKIIDQSTGKQINVDHSNNASTEVKSKL